MLNFTEHIIVFQSTLRLDRKLGMNSCKRLYLIGYTYRIDVTCSERHGIVLNK